MTTSIANLDVTQYVKVNQGANPITLQAGGDAVRIAFSSVKPAKDNEAFHVLTGKEGPRDFNLQDTDVWALATTDNASLAVSEFESSSVIGRDLADARVRVTSLSQAEYFTGIGKRYVVDYDEVYTGNETRYILFQMPPASSGFLVALQERRFKSRDQGAELEILWDSTGFTPGTPLPVFNENRNFDSDIGNMVASVIGTPTTEGTMREVDFLNDTGGFFASSGDISAQSGSRIYSPDSFFIAKVTNVGAGSNRIKLAYNWVELPIDALL